jgi:FlaA1/EpsC-like NDP-sugar epimerase
VDGDNIRDILEICNKTGVKVNILPAIYSMMEGRIKLQDIREVQVEDLLRRDTVKINMEEICEYLRRKVVLITGAGGSIGSELCRQVVKFSPAKIILVGHDENPIFEIEQELGKYFDKEKIVSVIASIRCREKINYIFDWYKPDVVFHAAAHKHVPLMELNPEEAIRNNILGTENVAEAADRINCEKFIFISTDKAVNPTNVMGATKRVAEMFVQSLNERSKTEFAAVRFGNVLGSNGSVLPTFKRQIAEGGPVTVTHPDITRYFMTIPEAVQLVVQAGAIADGGEIFVLDMGEPVKILDMAEDLIKLSGLEPGKDIQIVFSGLRPGEKLYEELLTSEEGTKSTKHEKIFVTKPVDIDFKELNKSIAHLEKLSYMFNREEIVNKLQNVVPTYKAWEGRKLKQVN